jgi:hypothetical protein
MEKAQPSPQSVLALAHLGALGPAAPRPSVGLPCLGTAACAPPATLALCAPSRRRLCAPAQRARPHRSPSRAQRAPSRAQPSPRPCSTCTRGRREPSRTIARGHALAATGAMFTFPWHLSLPTSLPATPGERPVAAMADRGPLLRVRTTEIWPCRPARNRHCQCAPPVQCPLADGQASSTPAMARPRCSVFKPPAVQLHSSPRVALVTKLRVAMPGASCARDSISSSSSQGEKYRAWPSLLFSLPRPSCSNGDPSSFALPWRSRLSRPRSLLCGRASTPVAPPYNAPSRSWLAEPPAPTRRCSRSASWRSGQGRAPARRTQCAQSPLYAPLAGEASPSRASPSPFARLYREEKLHRRPSPRCCSCLVASAFLCALRAACAAPRTAPAPSCDAFLRPRSAS